MRGHPNLKEEEEEEENCNSFEMHVKQWLL
jgi:hypothetical protein